MRCGQTYKWLILLMVHGFEYLPKLLALTVCSMTSRLSCRMVPSLACYLCSELALFFRRGLADIQGSATIQYSLRVVGWTGAFCLLSCELELLYLLLYGGKAARVCIYINAARLPFFSLKILLSIDRAADEVSFGSILVRVVTLCCMIYRPAFTVAAVAAWDAKHALVLIPP